MGGREEVAIITHPSVPIEQLSSRDVEDIYSLEELTWKDGSRIIVFDLKGKKSPIKQTFYAFIGRRPNDLKRLWLRVILSGEGQSPTLLDSPEDVLEMVAQTPGAIGYVPHSMASDAVKIVTRIK